MHVHYICLRSIRRKYRTWSPHLSQLSDLSPAVWAYALICYLPDCMRRYFTFFQHGLIPQGTRHIATREYHKGNFSHDLERDKLIISVLLHIWMPPFSFIGISFACSQYRPSDPCNISMFNGNSYSQVNIPCIFNFFLSLHSVNWLPNWTLGWFTHFLRQVLFHMREDVLRT